MEHKQNTVLTERLPLTQKQIFTARVKVFASERATGERGIDPVARFGNALGSSALAKHNESLPSGAAERPRLQFESEAG